MAPNNSVMNRIRMFEQQASSKGSPAQSGSTTPVRNRGKVRSWSPQTERPPETTEKVVPQIEKRSTPQKAKKKPPAFLAHFQKAATDVEDRHDACSRNTTSSPYISPLKSRPKTASPMKSRPKTTQPPWVQKRNTSSSEVPVLRKFESSSTEVTPAPVSFVSTKEDGEKRPSTPDENEAPREDSGGQIGWPSPSPEKPDAPQEVKPTKEESNRAASQAIGMSGTQKREPEPEPELEIPTDESDTIGTEKSADFSNKVSERSTVSSEETPVNIQGVKRSTPSREHQGRLPLKPDVPKQASKRSTSQNLDMKPDALDDQYSPQVMLDWPSEGTNQSPERRSTKPRPKSTEIAAVESTNEPVAVDKSLARSETSVTASTDRDSSKKESSTEEGSKKQEAPPKESKKEFRTKKYLGMNLGGLSTEIISSPSQMSDSTPRARSTKLAMIRHNRRRRSGVVNRDSTASEKKNPSEKPKPQASKSNLKRNLESASVIMQEEKASSIASGSSSQRSSLSTDELSSIARRAYQAAKLKSKTDKTSGNSQSTTKQKTHPEHSQPRHIKYDDNDASTVASDLTFNTKSSKGSARFSVLSSKNQSRTWSPAPSLDSEGEDTATQTSRSRSSTRSSRMSSLAARSSTASRPPKHVDAGEGSTVHSEATRSSNRSSRLSTGSDRHQNRTATQQQGKEVSDAASEISHVSRQSRSSKSSMLSARSSVKQARSHSPSPVNVKNGSPSASDAHSAATPLARSRRTPNSMSSMDPAPPKHPAAENASNQSAKNASSSTSGSDKPTERPDGGKTSASQDKMNPPPVTRPRVLSGGKRSSRLAMLSSALNRTQSASPVFPKEIKSREASQQVLRLTQSDVELQERKPSNSIGGTNSFDHSSRLQQKQENVERRPDELMSVASDLTSHSYSSYRSAHRRQSLQRISPALKGRHKSPSPATRYELGIPKHSGPSRDPADGMTGSSVDPNKFKSIGSAFKTARRAQSPSRPSAQPPLPKDASSAQNQDANASSLDNDRPSRSHDSGRTPVAATPEKFVNPIQSNVRQEAAPVPKASRELDTSPMAVAKSVDESGLQPGSVVHQQTARNVGPGVATEKLSVMPPTKGGEHPSPSQGKGSAFSSVTDGRLDSSSHSRQSLQNVGDPRRNRKAETFAPIAESQHSETKKPESYDMEGSQVKRQPSDGVAFGTNNEFSSGGDTEKVESTQLSERVSATTNGITMANDADISDKLNIGSSDSNSALIFASSTERSDRFSDPFVKENSQKPRSALNVKESSAVPGALEWLQQNYAFSRSEKDVNSAMQNDRGPASPEERGPASLGTAESQNTQSLVVAGSGDDDVFSGLDDASASQHGQASFDKASTQGHFTDVATDQEAQLESQPTDSFADDIFFGVAPSHHSTEPEPDVDSSFNSNSKNAEERKMDFSEAAPPPPPPKTSSPDPAGSIVDGTEVMDTVNSDITSSVLGGEPSTWEPTDWSRPSSSNVIKEERLEEVEEEDREAQSNHHSEVDVKSPENDSPPSKWKSPGVDQSISQSTNDMSGSDRDMEHEDESHFDDDDAYTDLVDSPASDSLFMSLGWGIIDTFTNGLCRVPGRDLGAHSLDEDEPQETLSYGDQETNVDTASVAASYTSQTVLTMQSIGSATSAASATQATLTDKERRVWDDWERRDSQSKSPRQRPIVSSPKNRDSVSPEKKQPALSLPERRENAREKLLGYADAAIKTLLSPPAPSGAQSREESSPSYAGESSSMYTTDTSYRTEDAGEITMKAISPKLKKNKPAKRSFALSFNQRRILEHFTVKLKTQGLEVLKLSRDKKWQLRYLTVSKEVSWLSVENSGSGDRGQCPRGVLWLKKFNAKSKDHSVSSIGKQGRGGVLSQQIQSVSAGGRANPQYPVARKHQAKFKNSAAVDVKYFVQGVSRSVTFLCRTTEEAHFLCTGMRVVMDVIQRYAAATGHQFPKVRYQSGSSGDTTEKPAYGY